MSEHELEKLLGGFTADTLTAEEKQALYGAALQDQHLFNLLVDEQALRELLADPAVRQRLLQSLNRTRPSQSDGSPAWLDWMRRPVHLAYAGGLTAALFAVVFGMKIYQDIQKQWAHSMATEEAQPAAPPVREPSGLQPATPEPAVPQPEAKENVPSATEAVKKDNFADALAKQGKPAPSTPEEPQTSRAESKPGKQRAEQDGLAMQSNRPMRGLEKTADDLKVSPDRKRAETSEPPAAAPEAPPPMHAPSAGSGARTTASITGARALFYAREPARSDQRIMESEREQSSKSTTEARRSLRARPKTERFSAASATGQLTPLGLRYGFAIRTTDGRVQETDMASALNSGEQARLTIEVNQEAYVQIWKTKGPSTAQLWFPSKETGEMSIKVPAGRRQGIPLTDVDTSFTLTIRLSRVPLPQTTEEEAATLEIPSNQLQETVTPRDSTGPEEQATYVVNKNLSPTVQLIVALPVRQ